MDLVLPRDDDPRRRAVQAWLAANPAPTGRQLAEAGYVVPHWPPPWGLDADPIMQLAIDDELKRSGVRRPVNPIGIGWAGPTLLRAGTPEQKERWLWPLLAGEEIWCQLFSEPGAGSDLTSLTTSAVLDGDEWVVSGQKVWTSIAHIARFGILLARTDRHAPRHRGISYFVCPMDASGIEVRPLVDMTGEHVFNEVFFDEVRIPADHLVGAVNHGWELAKVTLANERVSLSAEGALWGRGPTAQELVDLIQRSGSVETALRQRLATVWAEGDVLRMLRESQTVAATAGRERGPESSVRKALGDAHGQHLMNLGRDLAGPYGMLAGTGPTRALDPEWAQGFLYSPALTIGGGTAEVQRNIVAEHVLGLPRDPVPAEHRSEG